MQGKERKEKTQGIINFTHRLIETTLTYPQGAEIQIIQNEHKEMVKLSSDSRT